MVYGDLQFFDIIVFAAIAVFLIYRLRGGLGKRTGYEKGPTTNQYTSKKEEEPKKTCCDKFNECLYKCFLVLNIYIKNNILLKNI